VWRRAEDPTHVVGPRESPESHALGAESDLDALGVEAGEVAAGLEADAVEEGDEMLGGRQNGDRERGEVVAVGAGADNERSFEFLVYCRHFRRDRAHCHTSAHVGYPLLARHLEQSLRERSSIEPARVCPDTTQRPRLRPVPGLRRVPPHSDARRFGQQRDHEVSGERRAGRPARAPETDEAHDA
jgi:hypothetical protein